MKPRNSNSTGRRLFRTLTWPFRGLGNALATAAVVFFGGGIGANRYFNRVDGDGTFRVKDKVTLTDDSTRKNLQPGTAHVIERGSRYGSEPDATVQFTPYDATAEAVKPEKKGLVVTYDDDVLSMTPVAKYDEPIHHPRMREHPFDAVKSRFPVVWDEAMAGWKVLSKVPSLWFDTDEKYFSRVRETYRVEPSDERTEQFLDSLQEATGTNVWVMRFSDRQDNTGDVTYSDEDKARLSKTIRDAHERLKKQADSLSR